MPDAIGVSTFMGIKVVGSWTAAYAAVDTLIPYDSESLSRNFNRIADMSLLGSAGKNPSDQGVSVITGQTVHRVDFNNFDELFELWLGDASGRAFFPSDDTHPKYAWLEFDKGTSRWRFGPCKVAKGTLSSEKDGHLMLTLDWIARDLARDATVFPSLSLAGAHSLVRHEDLSALFDAISGGAPTSADRKRLESLEIMVDNLLVPDDYASQSVSGGDQKLPLEPIPNNFRDVSAKIKLPRYDSDADFVTWKESDTALLAELTFTRSGETLKLDLPHMKITEGFNASVGGPERIQNEGSLECYQPDGSNPLYTAHEFRATFT